MFHMRTLSVVFWGIVVLLAVLFAALNSSTVSIHYFFGSVKIYLPLLLVLQLLLGALIGAAAMLPLMFRYQGKSRKLKARVHQVEQEVINLRAIPFKDVH